MTWLLQLLLDAVREMVMQFIVDMMDLISSMFAELLSCDLDLFEELFGVAGDLYRNAVVPMGIAMLLLICVWKLYQSMFGKMGVSSEEPFELVFRSGFCLFLILYGKEIVNYILDLAGTPYQWIAGTDITVTSFSEYSGTAESVVGILGIDAISIQLLLLVMQLVVAWNYFKVLFVIAERYVLLGVLSYTAPLAFATGGSKATGNILSSWLRMFGGQVMIVLLDVWCLKLFLSAYGNLASSSYGFTKFFAATMCLIGFCKIIMKLDSYMASLGVNMGRTMGGLSGLGALMIAGRLLKGGGYRGSGKTAAGAITYGNGRTIPLGSAWGGAASMGKVSNMAMGDGKNGAVSYEEERKEDFGFPGEEKEQTGREVEFPFGMPEDGMGAGGIGTKPVGDVEEQQMEAADSMGNTAADYGETSETENPFGTVQDGATSGMEVPSGISGAEEEGSMDMPFGLPDEPEYQQEGYGENGLSAGNIESADMSADDINGAFDLGLESGPDDLGAYPFGTPDSLEIGDEEASAPGTVNSELLGTEGNSGMESLGGDLGYVSESGYETGDSSSTPDYTDAFGTGGVGYEVAGENISYAETMASETAGSEGTTGDTGFSGLTGDWPGLSDSEDGYGERISYSETTEKVSADMGAGTLTAGMEGRFQMEGSYEIERDGSRYMRYDSNVFEKPQAKYQTIQENGKTYYEIPKEEKAPAVLPKIQATLGKEGNIQVKKEYRRPQKEKRGKERQKQSAGKKGTSPQNRKKGRP